MIIHPELALRLAQAKSEDARSRAQHATAARAALADQRVSTVIVGTRRRRLRASAPRAAKG